MEVELERTSCSEANVTSSGVAPLSESPLIKPPVIVEEEEHKSMLALVASQFVEHKLAVTGLVTIGVFVIVALMAPLISQWTEIDPNVQNVFQRYQPAGTTIEISNDDRVAAFESYLTAHPDQVHALYTDLSGVGAVPAGSTDEKETLLSWVETSNNQKIRTDLKTVKTPAATEARTVVATFDTFHALGTDELGRDVFMRLLYGTRVSIGVGVLVALASALIGLLIGSVAGFYGGVLDSLLMRMTDSLLSLPQMPVLIVFAAVDLTKLPVINWFLTQQNESIAKLVVVLCLFSWMTVARLVRGSVLSLREREYILASRTLGARDSTLILTHMLPNVMAPLLVTVTVNVGQSILYEAALSFLGLGIQPPTPSWGNMLSNAQELVSVAPLLAIIPGLLIFITVISFNFVGDGLQEAINPKSVKR